MATRKKARPRPSGAKKPASAKLTSDQEAELAYFRQLRASGGEGLEGMERKVFDDWAESVGQLEAAIKQSQVLQEQLAKLAESGTQLQGKVNGLYELLKAEAVRRGDLT